MRRVLVPCLVLLAVLGLASPAAARSTPKKCLWGPSTVGGILSAYPQYAAAGVGTTNGSLFWDEVAKRRPKDPRSPKDPAYAWPEELDYVLSEAAEVNVRVALTVVRTPAWARGRGTGAGHLPTRPKDFADFLRAAAKKYPKVRFWRIWDVTNFAGGMQPLLPLPRTDPVTAAHREGPRRYARLLDAAYGALKRVSRRNRVIGGNTLSFGDIAPATFMKELRLPDGRTPRMDLWGHAPYTTRPPAFGRLQPLGQGTADFADLPHMLEWLANFPRGTDRFAPRLWISRWYLQSDKPGRQFDAWVSRDVQAAQLRTAMRQVLSDERIEALCWEYAFDELPAADGLELLGGLWGSDGAPKPALAAFRDA